MDEKAKATVEEPAQNPASQEEAIPELTPKQVQEMEAQRKAYLKNYRRQNEVMEEEVKFLRLQVEKFNLNMKVAEINEANKKAQEAKVPPAEKK